MSATDVVSEEYQAIARYLEQNETVPSGPEQSDDLIVTANGQQW